jgi:hypothetical protein
MTLARHQQSLERALRGRPVEAADVYARHVRSTRQWRLLEESVRFWRRLAVQRGAPLTAAFLLKHGRLHEMVDRLLAERLASPYTETMAEAFLVRVSAAPDEVAAALARTELALQRLARGVNAAYQIEWPIDPIAALASLLDPSRAEWPDQPGRWHLIVERRLPGLMSATRLA